MYIIAAGHEEIVRWLVNNDLTGTIAFIQDNNGDTPAHDAADNGYVSLYGVGGDGHGIYSYIRSCTKISIYFP